MALSVLQIGGFVEFISQMGKFILSLPHLLFNIK